MLIEGVSTLYFLNSQKDRDFGLFSAMTKLLEVFFGSILTILTILYLLLCSRFSLLLNEMMQK